MFLQFASRLLTCEGEKNAENVLWEHHINNIIYILIICPTVNSAVTASDAQVALGSAAN